MTTRIMLLNSSREIQLRSRISLDSETVEISPISRRMDELEGGTWHEGMVPCGTRGEDTWHMSGSQVPYSQLLHGMGG